MIKALAGASLACLALQTTPRPVVDLEQLPFSPRRTVCYRTPSAIDVDGKLDEPGWRATEWSEPFIDIDGVRRPPLTTRMKMLWDDEFLYFGADLEEPHLWATLTRRDSVIFQDNDFEVFIDPDGDTHAYYELEINALNTVWDLLLIRPYRDGGPAIHAWDIAGLATAVHLRGTLNRASDRDEGWSVEIAMPWRILREGTRRAAPPRSGDQWRVNFSRVQWQLDSGGPAYARSGPRRVLGGPPAGRAGRRVAGRAGPPASRAGRRSAGRSAGEKCRPSSWPSHSTPQCARSGNR